MTPTQQDIENSIKEYVTNDLSFAAYLLMNGVTLLKAKKLGKSYKFHFNVINAQINRIQVDWANSEASRFDAAVRDLKKILFSGSFQK